MSTTRCRICLTGNLGNDSRVSDAAQVFDVPIILSATGTEFMDEDSWDTVFVLEDFSGPVYDAIQHAEKRILGPAALQQYADRREGLASNSRPLYNLAMSGLVICFTGFEKDELERLTTLVHNMGGSVQRDMVSDVTHLIACTCEGDEYQSALTFSVPVMGKSWVYSAWEKRNEKTLSATSEEMMCYKLKPFHGARMCLFGFQDDERQHMIEVLEKNGGTTTDLLDQTCTHVVVDQSAVCVPQKVPVKATVVKAEWFRVSVQNEGRADEKDYLFKEESELGQRPDTLNEEQHVMEQQLCNHNEKDGETEMPEKQLQELQEGCGCEKETLSKEKQLLSSETEEVKNKLQEGELEQRPDTLNEEQHVMEQQLCNHNEKDGETEMPEKQLQELQERYSRDMQTLKLRCQELECGKETLLKEKQLLSLEAKELGNKLQENGGKLLESEALQQFYQEELQKSKHVITDLKNQLNSHVEAEENNRKEKINSQNCTEELRKYLEESTITSRKEISELIMQLKKWMADEEVIRLLKEELKEKSHKCKQLESENETLQRSLNNKETELQLLKTCEKTMKKEKEETENCKRKLLTDSPTPSKRQNEEKKQKLNEDVDKKFKPCCVVLHKLDGRYRKCESEDDKSQVMVLSDSSQINRQSHSTTMLKKTADENNSPCAPGNLDMKLTSDSQSRTLRKRPGSKEESKRRSKRKNLFSSNLDVSIEITPAETEKMAHSLSPARILKRQQM